MADKQQALVNAISEGVAAKMTPELTALANDIAKLLVAVNSCNARLSTLEVSVNSGGAAPKRATRTGGGKAAAGKGKPAAKGKPGAADASKVTNSLLFFRFAMSTNYNEYQDIYGTDENILEAEKDQTVGKRDKDKDPAGYWSAVGGALWKTVLSEEQKLEVRNDFNTWKEQSTRDESEAPLDEEDASADP